MRNSLSWSPLLHAVPRWFIEDRGQDGLVAARKEGRNRYYRLNTEGMGRLRDLVEQFWTDELDLLASDAAALARQRHGPPQHHPVLPDTSLQDKDPSHELR